MRQHRCNYSVFILLLASVATSVPTNPTDFLLRLLLKSCIPLVYVQLPPKSVRPLFCSENATFRFGRHRKPEGTALGKKIP